MPGPIDGDLGADHLRPRIKLQMKTCDNSKKAGPGAAGRPVDIGVLVWAGVAQFAIRANVIDGKHALACRPQRPAVPAKTALQQVAAKADALAMTDREEQLLPSKQMINVVATATRADGRAHRLPVDGHRIQTGNIEQHSAVADVVAGPAVSSRADADAPSIGVCKTYGCDHILFGPRLDDHVGIAIRQMHIPACGAARSVVAGVASAKGRADEVG